jgi:hypothetical protein
MCDLGVNESSLLQVELFPNPSSGSITLSGDVSEIKEATIYDLKGIAVKQLAVSEINTEISLKELKSGMYLLSLNGQTRVLRFQKI